MDGPELYADVNFVDKLIDIGVLQPKLPFESIANKFPLFLIEKLAQPEVYRDIADGKSG